MSIVAKALLVDKNGKILLLRRSGTHPHFAYHLDFPGGEVEHHETELAGVVREVVEETGLEVAVELFELVHHKVYSDVRKDLVFRANLDHAEPDVIISWEHDRLLWLTPEELVRQPLPAGVDPYYEVALEYVRSLLDN